MDDDGLGAWTALDSADSRASVPPRGLWGPPSSTRPATEQSRSKPAKKKWRPYDKIDRYVLSSSSGPSKLVPLPPESESGNVEYKSKGTATHRPVQLKLVGLQPSRFQHLVSQLLFRLSEGGGEAIYRIGLRDCGWPEGLPDPELQESLRTVALLAETLLCSSNLLGLHRGAAGHWAEVLVSRAVAPKLSCPTLLVAVAGQTAAGKSTLVALLSRGSGGNGAPRLDDGRGAARISVVRHKHEIQTGRTSSRSLHHCGYGASSVPLNHVEAAALDAAEAVSGQAGRSASRTEPSPCNGAAAESAPRLASVVSFVELAGHEKHAKTAMFGLTCLAPQTLCLVVAAPCSSQHDGPTRTQRRARGGSRRFAGSGPCFAGAEGSDSEEAVGTSGVAEALPPMARQHLAAALALGIPAFVVVTKVDAGITASSEAATSSGMETHHVDDALLDYSTVVVEPAPRGLSAAVGDIRCALMAVARSDDVDTAAPLVQSAADARAAASSVGAQVEGGQFSQPLVIPVFPVSCVTGAGLAQLHEFLSSLSSQRQLAQPKVSQPEEPLLQVEQVIEVTGHRLVAAGKLVSGTIRTGDELVLGPLGSNRGFAAVRVATIRCAHVPVRSLVAGQAATLQLEPAETRHAAGSTADKAHHFDAAASAPSALAGAPRGCADSGSLPTIPAVSLRHCTASCGGGLYMHDRARLSSSFGQGLEGLGLGSLASIGSLGSSLGDCSGSDMELTGLLGSVTPEVARTAGTADELRQRHRRRRRRSGDQVAHYSPPRPLVGLESSTADGPLGASPLGALPEDALEDVTTVLLSEEEANDPQQRRRSSSVAGGRGRSEDECAGEEADLLRTEDDDDGCGWVQTGRSTRCAPAFPEINTSCEQGSGCRANAGEGAVVGPGGPGGTESAGAPLPPAPLARPRQQKGLFILPASLARCCPVCWEFDAAIVVLSDLGITPGRHKMRGQLLVCCGSIRQAAKMVGLTDASKLPDWAVRTICCNAGAACVALFSPGSRSSATLEEGSPALAPTPASLVRFRFLTRPEWVPVGGKLLVADLDSGRLYASGQITAATAAAGLELQHSRDE